MGRKKMTAAERAERARRSGFDHDISGIDDTQVYRPLVRCTTKKYQQQWDTWMEYTKAHPDASPHDMRTAKHFIEFIARNMEGIDATADEDRPKVDSIRVYWRCFTSEWRRRNEPIPEQVRSTITNVQDTDRTQYIQGQLKTKLGLSLAKREQNYLTVHIFHVLLRQMWENDWHEYRHDGYRVLWTAEFQLFMYTSSRTGELVESSARPGTGDGLRYRDIAFVVRLHEGEPEMMITVCRQHAKGMTNTSHRRPRHPMYENTPVLAINAVAFILAIALATNAFRDYSTLEEILAIRPANNEPVVVEWSLDKLNSPVFTNATGNMEKAGNFGQNLADVGHRAGYIQNITVYDGRREALTKADWNGYSESERMMFGAHRDPSMFRKSYMTTMVTVDGQASFLGEPLRRDYHEDLRGMSLRRNPQLWQTLPAKLKDDLESSPEYVALDAKIEALTAKIGTVKFEDSERDRAYRKTLYKEKRQLTLNSLQEWRKQQPRKAEQDMGSTDRCRTRFSRVRHLMPERDRLATNLFLPIRLRSPEGQAVVQDLIALCKNNRRVAYHPNLQPSMDRCPSPQCTLKMDSIPIKDRWEHIYKCHMMNLKRRYGFAQLCFSCDVWFTDPAGWDKHCQEHLNQSDTLPLQCDPLVFRYTLACPGLCPFCLGDSRLLASQRMCQFTTRQKWQQHVYKHVQKATKTTICKHPQCEMAFNSNQDLLHHLDDIHHIEFTKATKRQQSKSETESIDRPAKRARHTPLDQGLHDMLPVQTKERSGSAQGKAEFRFFNYDLDTFKPNAGHSRDTSPTSIFSSEPTRTETPATSVDSGSPDSESLHNIDPRLLNA